jgi:hypothetical protein
MPCYNDWPTHNFEMDSTRKELDKVTRVACELNKHLKIACGVILGTKKLSDIKPISKETTDWVAEHEVFDKRRKKKSTK